MPNKQPHREPENAGRKSPRVERHNHDEEHGKGKFKDPQKNQETGERDSKHGFPSPSKR